MHDAAVHAVMIVIITVLTAAIVIMTAAQGKHSGYGGIMAAGMPIQHVGMIIYEFHNCIRCLIRTSGQQSESSDVYDGHHSAFAGGEPHISSQIAWRLDLLSTITTA